MSKRRPERPPFVWLRRDARYCDVFLAGHGVIFQRDPGEQREAMVSRQEFALDELTPSTSRSAGLRSRRPAASRASGRRTGVPPHGTRAKQKRYHDMESPHVMVGNTYAPIIGFLNSR
jgi:hypothetical protein